MARSIARDHEKKRLAILATAARFFAEHGFDRSSMSQLATACNVSKALIYHYYDSKDALLFDIVYSHLSDLLVAVTKAAEGNFSPETTLRAIIRAILLAYRDADAQHQLQDQAMRILPATEHDQLAARQRQMVQIMSRALSNVTPHHFANQPQNLRPVAMTVFGMLNWFYMWHRPGKGISREDYADLVADMVMRGIFGLEGARPA